MGSQGSGHCKQRFKSAWQGRRDSSPASGGKWEEGPGKHEGSCPEEEALRSPPQSSLRALPPVPEVTRRSHP